LPEAYEAIPVASCADSESHYTANHSPLYCFDSGRVRPHPGAHLIDELVL